MKVVKLSKFRQNIKKSRGFTAEITKKYIGHTEWMDSEIESIKNNNPFNRNFKMRASFI
jgi:hypothetical protein